MKKKLILPKFKNEDEEREFWWKLDLSEYYGPKDLEKISFPKLKPTSRKFLLESDSRSLGKNFYRFPRVNPWFSEMLAFGEPSSMPPLLLNEPEHEPKAKPQG